MILSLSKSRGTGHTHDPFSQVVVRAAFDKASQGISRVATLDNFRVVFLVLLKLEFESPAMDMRSTCYADRNTGAWLY